MEPKSKKCKERQNKNKTRICSAVSVTARGACRVNPEEDEEEKREGGGCYGAWWEGFAEKEDVKPLSKKNVDILSITVSMLYHFNLLNAMPICH